MKAAYPNFYKDITKSDVQAMVNLWTTILGEFEYELVSNAVTALVCINTYPPSIAEIKKQLHSFLSKDSDLTEMEAWNLVKKALSNSSYNSETEYQKLPDIVKKCVGSPSMLKEWCIMPIDQVQSVIQSNFMRTFRAKKEVEAKQQLLPQNEVSFIENINFKLLK